MKFLDSFVCATILLLLYNVCNQASSISVSGSSEKAVACNASKSVTMGWSVNDTDVTLIQVFLESTDLVFSYDPINIVQNPGPNFENKVIFYSDNFYNFGILLANFTEEHAGNYSVTLFPAPGNPPEEFPEHSVELIFIQESHLTPMIKTSENNIIDLNSTSTVKLHQTNGFTLDFTLVASLIDFDSSLVALSVTHDNEDYECVFNDEYTCEIDPITFCSSLSVSYDYGDCPYGEYGSAITQVTYEVINCELAVWIAPSLTFIIAITIAVILIVYFVEVSAVYRWLILGFAGIGSITVIVVVTLVMYDASVCWNVCGNRLVVFITNPVIAAVAIIVIVFCGLFFHKALKPPTDFQLKSVGPVTIVLEWLTGYDGGYRQTFDIVCTNTRTGQVLQTQEIPDTTSGSGQRMKAKIEEGIEPETGQCMEARRVEGIKPKTTYSLEITARNRFGKTTANKSIEVTTPDANNKSQEDMRSAKSNVSASAVQASVATVGTTGHKHDPHGRQYLSTPPKESRHGHLEPISGVPHKVVKEPRKQPKRNTVSPEP